jgi:WD40 repeat protein
MSERSKVSVFLSSPTDVQSEREAAERVVSRLGGVYAAHVELTLERWERRFYEASKGFQEAIAAMETFHLIVGVLWKRIGSELPPQTFRRPDGTPFESGTVYEIETALAASQRSGRPAVYIFRKTSPVTYEAERVDEQRAQKEALDGWWARTFRDEAGHYIAATNSFNTTEDFEAKFENCLADWLRNKGYVPSGPVWGVATQGSPYPGLIAYERDRSLVFFGRQLAIEQARDELLAAVARETGLPALFVIGASGSGKSSLVRAGLVPQLTRPGAVPEVDLWCTAVTAPTADSLASLAAHLYASDSLPELAASAQPEPERWARMVARSPEAAADSVAWALDHAAEAEARRTGAGRKLQASLLLVLDQLESLFRTLPPDHDQVTFTRVLRALVAGGRVWLLTTLRSDHYAAFQRDPDLLALKRAGATYDLPPPGPAEIADIVKGPARAAGLTFDECDGKSLARVLVEAAPNADALPLLQMTLAQLFERREGAKLSFASYEAIGEVEGAIAAHANAVFDQVSPAAQRELGPLVEQLVRDVARRSDRQIRFTAQVADRKAFETSAPRRELVEVLVNRRLLVSDDGNLRVAHEALLRRWDRARDSLERLADAELRKARLQRALAIVAAVVFFGVAGIAFWQWSEAQREARAARAALSGQTATHSQLSLQDFPQRSLLLAVEALNITAEQHEPPVGAAEKALRQALAHAGGVVLGRHEKPISAVNLSPDGRWLVTVAEAENGARLWDLATASGATNPIELQGGGGHIAISPNSQWLVTVSSQGQPTRLWDLAAQSPGTSSRILSAAKEPVVFSRDNRWLVTGGDDKSVRLWSLSAADSADPPIVLPAQTNPVTVVAVSPDSRWLVTSSWDPEPHSGITDICWLWDLTAERPEASRLVLGGNTSSISNVIFTPDSHWLATSSAEQDRHTGRSDKTVRLWDLTKKNPSAEPIPLEHHQGSITTMTSSIDSRWLVTGSEDKTVRLWDLEAVNPADKPLEFAGHENRVVGAVISPDNRWLVTFTGKPEWHDYGERYLPTARLWELGTSGQSSTASPRPTVFDIQGRPVEVSGFVPSFDGRWLLIRSNSSVYVLDLKESQPAASPRILQGHEAAVTVAQFSHDSQKVVTGSEDKSVRLWHFAEVQPAANPVILNNGNDSFMEVSPDNRWLVTSAEKGAVLWDLAARDIAVGPVFLRGHNSSVSSAAFSYDSLWLATGSFDNTARLWKLSTKDPNDTAISLDAHKSSVNSVTFSQDHRWLATGSSDNTIRLWDLTRSHPSSGSMALRTDGSVVRVHISANSRWLVASGLAPTSLWDLSAKDPSQTARRLPDSEEILPMMSPDRRWLVTFGSEERRTLRAQIHAKRQELSQGPSVLGSKGYDIMHEIQDLERKDNDIVPITKLWDLAAKDPAEAPRVLDKGGEPVTFSPDGRWLVSKGTDDVPRLWALTAQDMIAVPIELRGHNKILNAAAFSSDNHWLVTGSHDGDYNNNTVRLWNLNARDITASSRILKQYKWSYGTIAISHDSHWLLVTYGTTSDLWKLQEDGLPPQPITLPIDDIGIPRAVFTRDGRWLLIRSNGIRNYGFLNSISLWMLRPHELIDLACRTAGRNLTNGEWNQFFTGQPYRKVCPNLD